MEIITIQMFIDTKFNDDEDSFFFSIKIDGCNLGIF